MAQPIFYFNKLSSWDKTTIVLYCALTIGLYYFVETTTDNMPRRDVFFLYPFGTQLFLYLFNYKSLRNLTVYFFWIAIGLLHLVFYFLLRNNVIYDSPETSLKGFRNTIILLLLYQVLRFISAKTQGQELVSPSKSGTDLFDERRVTFIDLVLFAVYIATATLLLFL